MTGDGRKENRLQEKQRSRKGKKNVPFATTASLCISSFTEWPLEIGSLFLAMHIQNTYTCLLKELSSR